MAGRILTHFKQRIKGFELEPSGGGSFEITAGGELIYSKLATGAFPDEQAILAQLEKKL